MSTQDGSFVIRGKHVLIAVLAMFGIVIAVNLTFVFFALDSWTGLTTQNAYQEGLTYNQVLAARDAQRDLGWQGSLELGRRDAADSVTLILTDRDGAPLAGLAIAGLLRRPTHEGLDRPLEWRGDGAGRYTALVELPERGNWDLELTADDGRHPPFEMKARLWFK
jgi:nitrogen fixation protein FixH